ncbi:MAG TPA: hypothetical protein VF178_00810 [Gemmatimonadaceae bacterium]
MGLHSTRYAYLVIDPPRLVAYFDIIAADEHAKAAGAVLTALPIIADHRPAPGHTFLDAINAGEVRFPVAFVQPGPVPDPALANEGEPDEQEDLDDERPATGRATVPETQEFA